MLMVAEEEELVVEMLMVMVMVAEEEEMVVVVVMVRVMSSSEMVFELSDGGPQHMR